MKQRIVGASQSARRIYRVFCLRFYMTHETTLSLAPCSTSGSVANLPAKSSGRKPPNQVNCGSSVKTTPHRSRGSGLVLGRFYRDDHHLRSLAFSFHRRRERYVNDSSEAAPVK